MPYKLSKNGLCVEKADTGKTVKCHPTHDKAVAHLAALQINVVEQGKEQTMMTCPNCGAQVKAGAKTCPECGAKMGMPQATKELKPSDYLVVDKGVTHLPIAKTSGTPDRGLCGAAWAALFSPGGFRGNKYEGPKKEDAKRKLKAIYTRMDWPMPVEGQKELSLDKKASMIRDAWREQFDSRDASGVVGDKTPFPGWPREVYTDHVIVERDSKLYRFDFEYQDGEIVFDQTPIEVTSVYVPVLAITKELTHGVKAITKAGKNYLVIWTTNAFRDREGEIFSTKAIEDYVDRRDQTGIKDRVWFWHVKGSDFATVEWQGLVGKFLVEVAAVDDTAYGQKMFHAVQHPEDYPDLLPHGWGSSHGYLYRASDKQNHVYSFFEKYETTLLPYHRASNTYGGLKEVIAMAKMTEEKKLALATLVGEDKVKEILGQPEKATELLTLLGVDTKELAEEQPEVEGETPAAEAEVEAAVTSEEVVEEEANKEAGDVYELELDDTLVAAIASKVDVKGQLAAARKEWVADVVKAVKEVLTPAINQLVEEQVAGSKERVVSDALGGRLRLKPYSPTQAKDNVLDTASSKEVADQVAAEKENQRPQGDQLVAQLAQGMLSGTLH